jgi:hypothetical protein
VGLATRSRTVATGSFGSMNIWDRRIHNTLFHLELLQHFHGILVLRIELQRFPETHDGFSLIALCHMFEIPVNNVQRASASYKTVFGWKIEPWNCAYGVRTGKGMSSGSGRS